MPSNRRHAVLVALFVALAGCNAISGIGDSPGADAGPAEQHIGFLSSSTHAYNATITITDDSGETVDERTLSFDGTEARYVSLTTLNGSGNYTIHVQTDLPAVGGGDMSATHTVLVDPGAETTVVHTDYHDIEFVSGTAKRSDVEVPVRTNWIYQHPGEISYTIHRGTAVVANQTVVTSGTETSMQETDTINTTGVYWVVASSNFTSGSTYAVGVVNQSTTELLIGTRDDGHVKVRFRAQQNGGSFASQPPGEALKTRPTTRQAN